MASALVNRGSKLSLQVASKRQERGCLWGVRFLRGLPTSPRHLSPSGHVPCLQLQVELATADSVLTDADAYDQLVMDENAQVGKRRPVRSSCDPQ
jgi:hypothetical protein